MKEGREGGRERKSWRREKMEEGPSKMYGAESE